GHLGILTSAVMLASVRIGLVANPHPPTLPLSACREVCAKPCGSEPVVPDPSQPPFRRRGASLSRRDVVSCAQGAALRRNRRRCLRSGAALAWHRGADRLFAAGFADGDDLAVARPARSSR